MGTTIRCDLAIVGGGLAGGLIALAVKARAPSCDVRIVEGGTTLGGEHVWSFSAAMSPRPIAGWCRTWWCMAGAAMTSSSPT